MKRKIRIDSHGISPWHYFLESMSWGFSRSRKLNNKDMMAFLNVDPALKDGGQGLEDVLMADFLQSLSFMGDEFVNRIIKKAEAISHPDSAVSHSDLQTCEIRGNAGNYYIPYEDEKRGVRLVQPDGWIADHDTLILLEAKGYRKGASLNPGQLAKEYLIAKSTAANSGKNNFFVLLIVKDNDGIYKKGKKNIYKLTPASFDELWKANVADLESRFGDILQTRLQEEKDGISWDVFLKTESSKIRRHFLWITWREIKNLADEYPNDPCAQQISNTIAFHSSQDHAGTRQNMPIFSQLLAELAETKEPLYHFYNGGCGNKILRKYEDIYLTVIGHQKNPWDKWHGLKVKYAELFEELSILEERRRIAISLLHKTEKEIQRFYKTRLEDTLTPDTTRRAFEILGESSQTEETPSESNFIQRMNVQGGKIIN